LQNNKKEERKSQNRAFIDKSTNSLIFYGTDSEAEEAEQVISQLDVPARQVSLEAKVVALQKDAAKELGVEWDWSKVPQYPEQEKDYSSSVRHRVKDADGNEVTVTEDEPHYKVKRHTDGEGTPGIVQFGRGPGGHPFEFYYAAKINALLSDGKAKLLARPNIVTVQGQEASINIGGEVPVPQVKTTERETTTSLTYKQAGIILRCTPIVNDDGHITAKVHTEVSSPLYVDSMKAYRFQKREADTLVRLADGETMVIGGLIGSEEARSLSKVPFLGDLPILGAFFRNVKDSKTDSEVMIFLTARILQDK
jgi:type IV pilus assembly protein PilQ